MNKILIYFCVSVVYFVSCSKTYICVSNDNEEAIAMSVRKNDNVMVLFPKIVEGWEEKVYKPELLKTVLYSRKNFILDRRWEELPIFKNKIFSDISGDTFGISVFFVQKTAKLQIKNGNSLVYDIHFVKNDSVKGTNNCWTNDRLYLFEVPENDWLHLKIVNNQEYLTFTNENVNCIIEGNFNKIDLYVDNNLWKFHNYSFMMVDCYKSLEFQNTNKTAQFLDFYASANSLNPIHFVDVNDTNNKTQKNINDSWNYLTFPIKEKIFLSLISTNSLDRAFVSDFTLRTSIVTRMVKYYSENHETVKCHFINKKNQGKLIRGQHNCEIDESKYCTNVKNCEICCKGKCYQIEVSELYRAYVFSFYSSSAIIGLILTILILALIFYSLQRKNPSVYKDFNTKNIEPGNNVYQEVQESTELTEIPKVYYKFFDRHLETYENTQTTNINIERRNENTEPQEPLYCTYVGTQEPK